MLGNTEKSNLEELLESQEKLFDENGTKRIHREAMARERNCYQKDYSRIMYSSSFRRLQGKMQLMSIDENKFNSNRLTHSLEVSQIARSIAGILQSKIDEFELDFDIYNGEQIYVVEAGALAHDIGNAPFGHHGENILNKLMNEYGGYEGNAQSLRTLMNIEKKHPNFPGLNLTLRTLLSIIKYNTPHNGSAKKFLYREEYNELVNNLEKYQLTNVMRTLDVQIIDAADEIAYCAHDLEDALAQNYFSIDEFLFDLKIDAEKNKHPYKDELNLFEKWVEEAKEKAEKSNVYKSSEEYSFIFRKELTSIIVNGLIRDLEIVSVEDDLKDDFKYITGTTRENELAFRHWRLVRGIKYCTFEGINRSNDIQIYEKIGTKVITGLYQALSDERFNDKMLLLPVEYRADPKDSMAFNRKIADYIGGLMDTSAIELYKDIYGKNSLDRVYDSKFIRLKNKNKLIES